jgi:hypothetical protein
MTKYENLKFRPYQTEEKDAPYGKDEFGWISREKEKKAVEFNAGPAEGYGLSRVQKKYERLETGIVPTPNFGKLKPEPITKKEEAVIILNRWEGEAGFSKKQIKEQKQEIKDKTKEKWQKGKDKKYKIDKRSLF